MGKKSPQINRDVGNEIKQNGYWGLAEEYGAEEYKKAVGKGENEARREGRTHVLREARDEV